MVLSNHQIVVVAAFLVGAASRRTDTEDIAVKGGWPTQQRLNENKCGCPIQAWVWLGWESLMPAQ